MNPADDRYVPDLESGEYNGYRPAGRRTLSGGIKDKVEVYNIPSGFCIPVAIETVHLRQSLTVSTRKSTPK